MSGQTRLDVDWYLTLHQHGVRHGDRVLLHARNSNAVLESMFVPCTQESGVRITHESESEVARYFVEQAMLGELRRADVRLINEACMLMRIGAVPISSVTVIVRLKSRSNGGAG